IEVGLRGTQVGDVDCLPRVGCASGCSSSQIGTGHGRAPQLRRVWLRYSTVKGRWADDISFAEPERTVAHLTESGRVCKDGLKYWLQISWRTADDAQNLGSCLLPLQRLAQLAGDHRLPLRRSLVLL